MDNPHITELRQATSRLDADGETVEVVLDLVEPIAELLDLIPPEMSPVVLDRRHFAGLEQAFRQFVTEANALADRIGVLDDGV